MKSILIGTLAAILAAGAQSNEAERQLKAAMNAELVNGDLKTAIKQYGEIAAKYAKTDRSVAATALVHMAECYQKLGNAESRKVYERVVREYADQKEAVATARVRLGRSEAAGHPNGMAARQVWTAPARRGIYGAVSRDGRLVPYVNWDENGDLFVHDLATGADRRLTNTASRDEFAEGSAFSRDGKQLAYAWLNGKNRYELRIVGVQGAGIPEFRRLFDNEDVSYISPDDWSPDGKWVAVQLHRRDRSTQIGLIAIQDGSLRVLKSVDWRGPTRVFFSSDGRYLAFDLPASDTTEQRDIFLLAVDGSGEIPAVVHPSQDVLVGWSPDGKRLLFASDRSGTTGLWALAFDGRPQGTPELLKPEIGRHEFMGVTTSGALYSAIWNSGGGPEIRVASFDFTAGKFLSKPVAPIQTFVGANESPDWSPDGRYLAYASLRGTVGSRYFVLGIRSVETGQIRELTPSPSFVFFQGLVWAPDGRSLLVGGLDAKGRHGIFRVDAQTGQTTVIVPREGNDGPHHLASSPDGKKLYYRSHPPGARETAVVERDLASGHEKELFLNRFIGSVRLSPDGRNIAAGITDESTKSAAAVMIPVSGGEPRELMRVDEPTNLTGFTGQLVGVAGWTPDSRSVLLRKSSPAGRQSETWLVSLDGKQRKLDLDLGIGRRIPQIRLHPDGQQIAFEISGPQKPPEIWVLENFLPTLKASK
ncbi:MAG: PD40 domain-containing protein [Bryobacterales bacterium]|nr:PD40 domain-containing protein [Bryobacterales bacterium]